VSAGEALKAARAVGIRLGIDGGDLLLEAAAPPPAPVLDLLSRHKADVVQMLCPAEDGWSAEDWQVFFDERASIAEFDGGLSGADAEAQAFECCVIEWLNRHPERSPPGHCLACGGRDQATIRCCPTVSKAPAMPGFIRTAGQPGTRGARPRPLRR
jgi:hypothetical protein